MATSERTRPVVAVVIVVALVADLGGWWWTNRDTDLRLGDYGEVTATVTDPACGGLQIEVDGLRLVSEHRPLPSHWVGSTVGGSLDLTDRRGENGVEGTFVAFDGTEVGVYGGIAGEYFFPLGCGMYPASAGAP